MKFIIVLLIATCLYSILKMARVFLLDSGKIKGYAATSVFLTLELFLWISFFFLSIDALFASKSYYNYLFIVLVIVFVSLISWFLVKELIAGALFKIQYNPKPGKYMQAGVYEGTIERIRGTYLTLESLDNKSVKIPFSKLQTEVITLGDQKEWGRGEYRLKIKFSNQIDQDDVIRKVKTLLLQSPFCSFKKPVRVRVLEETESTILYEISFAPVSLNYVSRIESVLEKAFG